MQDVMQQARDEAHVRPDKATGPRCARDNQPAPPQAQVAAPVLARLWIVLRSCACLAADGLSTPVDKRVEIRAESVSGVRPGGDDKGAPATVRDWTVDPGYGGRALSERSERAGTVPRGVHQ